MQPAQAREAGESAACLHLVDLLTLRRDTNSHWANKIWPVLASVLVFSSYLLSLGADPELENDCGEKAADLIDPDNKELLELFGLAVNDWELLALNAWSASASQLAGHPPDSSRSDGKDTSVGHPDFWRGARLTGGPGLWRRGWLSSSGSVQICLVMSCRSFYTLWTDKSFELIFFIWIR